MRLAAFVCLFLTVAVAASAQVPSQYGSRGRLRTLITARAVHSLPAPEAVRGYPVRLRAVVTYYDPYIDPRHGALFVQDSTGGVFVAVPVRPILPLKPGSEVEVTGVTGPGDYASIVDGGHVVIEGPPHLPRRAPRVTLTQLLSGSVDCKWVEVEGRVHQVRFIKNRVALELATIQGPLTALSTRVAGANYDSFVDAKIMLRGVVAPVFDHRRQMVGVHIYFPSLNQVKVVEAAPRDAFALPVVPISRILRFSTNLTLPSRVHVRGRVTLRWPDRMLCIQQGTDSLCMQTTDGSKAPVGDSIDVVGFPVVKGFKPTLEDATLRLGGDVLPIAAKLVTAREVLKGDYDSQRVQIDAVLIGRDLTAENPTLMLRSEGVLFPAALPKGLAGDGKLTWKDGSLLRLTGICTVGVDAAATGVNEGQVRPDSIKLLLNSAEDVEVVHSPSWWTPARAIEAFSIALFVAFAALAWIFVLRRQVEQKTEALRDSQERLRHLSEHDALTRLPNRLLLNDRLEVALKRAARFEACLGLLIVDVDRFKEVNDVYGHLAGDSVLCELANRLTNSVRSTDTVARMGGDEFIVLLSDLRIAVEAEAIAAKIVAAVSVPIDIGEACAAITVSIGVSVYPDGGTDMKSLLRAADVALYLAKERGKNGFQVYRPNMERTARSTTSYQSSSQAPLPILGS